MLARRLFQQKSALSLSISSVNARGLSTTNPNQKIALTAQEELDKWNANNKKFNRPLSPHLTIYEWSLPMTMSAFYRIFSVGLAFTFLLAPMAFTGAPLVGFEPFGVATIAQASEAMRMSAIGTAVVLGIKSAFIVPLVFHLVNGCRHLGWDMKAYGIRHLKDVYTSGNIVLATTLVISLALIAYHRSEF